MAWSASAVFRAFVTDILGNVAAFDLSGAGVDTFKAALYDNDITPSKDVSSANSAYNADQWVTTNNEVFQAGQWAQGGVALVSPAVTNPSTGVAMFDADNPASGTAATLVNVYGVLIYDDTLATPVADQGVCYNYLGGLNSVTNGQLTVVFSANGIFRGTV